LDGSYGTLLGSTAARVCGEISLCAMTVRPTVEADIGVGIFTLESLRSTSTCNNSKLYYTD